jgi:predicted thioesterase
LNIDKIETEKAEAKTKVRDEEGEVIHTCHTRKIVRRSENLVVKKALDLRFF